MKTEAKVAYCPLILILITLRNSAAESILDKLGLAPMCYLFRDSKVKLL